MSRQRRVKAKGEEKRRNPQTFNFFVLCRFSLSLLSCPLVDVTVGFCLRALLPLLPLLGMSLRNVLFLPSLFR